MSHKIYASVLLSLSAICASPSVAAPPQSNEVHEDKAGNTMTYWTRADAAVDPMPGPNCLSKNKCVTLLLSSAGDFSLQIDTQRNEDGEQITDRAEVALGLPGNMPLKAAELWHQKIVLNRSDDNGFIIGITTTYQTPGRPFTRDSNRSVLSLFRIGNGESQEASAQYLGSVPYAVHNWIDTCPEGKPAWRCAGYFFMEPTITLDLENKDAMPAFKYSRTLYTNVTNHADFNGEEFVPVVGRRITNKDCSQQNLAWFYSEPDEEYTLTQDKGPDYAKAPNCSGWLGQ